MLKKLKALYVNIYLVFACAVSGYAIWQWQSSGDWLTWTGVLLSAAPMLLFISFIMLKSVVARTSENLIEAHIPIATGVLLALYGSYNQGTALPALLAVLAYVGFLTYVFWYSRYGREGSEKLQVGNALPAFTLKDVEGNAISSRQLCDKPSVIMFYRGNWCPLCMAQIKEVAAS
ncbi:MAG: redoxin domain-containing protein, partial [Spongiibacteraceae bacterium]